MNRVLHHVALGAHHVETLAAFYRDVLGLTERRRQLKEDGSLHSVWLALGGAAMLMVEQSDHARRRVEGLDAGWFLLALHVEEGERAALEARLEQAGCEFEEKKQYTTYLRDPEGNRVAVSHHPLLGGF